MHILTANIHGNPNIGLYAYANDKFCLVGHEVPSSLVKQMEKVLKVPCHKLTIAGTSLIGVFVTGNNKCLLIPEITYKKELKILEKLKIKYEIINTKHTALGNNILCNDKGCLVSSEFEQTAIKQIEKALMLKPKIAKIADLDIVGSLAVHNKMGCLLHRDCEVFELKNVEKTLKIECDIGTINFGNPYIRSGVVANSNGFIIGSLSTGPEIDNVDHVLKFI